MRKTTSGFTIVELLIVIVVIAILAAISIVAYNGIQNRSYDSTVQNDLMNLKKKLELQKVDTGTYIESAAMGFRASQSAYTLSPTTPYNLLLCRNIPSFDKFWVVAMSKSGNTFTVADSYNVKSLTLPWLPNQADMCVSIGAATPGSSNNRGYAADDTTTGPWRTWTGGN